jgi:hypothetical protein
LLELPVRVDIVCGAHHTPYSRSLCVSY